MTTVAEPLVFWRYIASSLDRLIGCLDGLDAAQVAWFPPAPGANSLAVLVAHMLGNAEENLLGTLGGQSIARDRDAEFRVRGASAAELAAAWVALRPRLEAALAALPDGALDRDYAHPRRGTIGGREILIVVARHAAEHLGQAELTRDLLRAAEGRR